MSNPGGAESPMGVVSGGGHDGLGDDRDAVRGRHRATTRIADIDRIRGAAFVGNEPGRAGHDHAQSDRRRPAHAQDVETHFSPGRRRPQGVSTGLASVLSRHLRQAAVLAGERHLADGRQSDGAACDEGSRRNDRKSRQSAGHFVNGFDDGFSRSILPGFDDGGVADHQRQRDHFGYHQAQNDVV